MKGKQFRDAFIISHSNRDVSEKSAAVCAVVKRIFPYGFYEIRKKKDYFSSTSFSYLLVLCFLGNELYYRTRKKSQQRRQNGLLKDQVLDLTKAFFLP